MGFVFFFAVYFVLVLLRVGLVGLLDRGFLFLSGSSLYVHL